MLVYIQKKINGVWRTLLTCNSVYSSSAFTHLCTQYCQHKFRISLDKTDDMLTKPQGLCRKDALDSLCNVKLVGLTEKQSRETFKKIVDIISDVDKWHKTPGTAEAVPFATSIRGR